MCFIRSIQENSWIIFLLIMAAIFWVYRLVKVFCNFLSYWEIRQFYIKALKIKMVSAVFFAFFFASRAPKCSVKENF